MKKQIYVLIIGILITSMLFTGCGKKVEESKRDTTGTKVETTVTSDDAKKAEEAKKTEEDAKKAEEAKKVEETKKAEEAKKAEETKKAEEAKQTAATTTTVAKTSSATAKSSGSNSTTTTKPSTPTTTTKPTTPTKQSGIDWGLTNTLRSYRGNQGMYTGSKRAIFDQYLLDIVNGKISSSTASSQLKNMTWVEVPWDTSISTTPIQHGIRVVDYHANSTTSSDPIDINGQAGFPPSEYKQVIVTYDANTGKYTTHVLGLFFVYTTKN